MAKQVEQQLFLQINQRLFKEKDQYPFEFAGYDLFSNIVVW